MVCLRPLAFGHPDPRQFAGEAARLSSRINGGQALDGTDLVRAERHHCLKQRRS